MTPVDLCLVLLLDASGSVDRGEWSLQADATAAALNSPAILEKILAGPSRRVAVTALEWSDSTATILPWTVIASPGDAQSAGLVLQTYQRKQTGSTAVGDALLAAGQAIGAARDQGIECLRQVVDISSDGSSNAGSDPRAAVLLLQSQDVQVNAIVIPDEIGVIEFYERTVQGFVLPARWESYGESIRRKLDMEISGIEPDLRKQGFPVDRFARSTCALDSSWPPASNGVCIRYEAFAYQPWYLGRPPMPEGPLPLYPLLSPTPDVPAPPGAGLLALGLLLIGLLRGRRR